MPRYRITVEYDGSSFVGWQIQGAGETIQGALTEAIFKFTGERVVVSGAGRTDAGVHATGQVAHFDLTATWAPGRIRDAMNFHLLPARIAVRDCAAVGPEFDARRSAISRRYLYRLLVRRARPALELERVWWVPVELDSAMMHASAQQLVGRHDFTTFRASQCQAKSAIRTLDRLDVTQSGEEIHVHAQARSFLHNQVRSMVGTLKLAGQGRLSPRDVGNALAARDRTRCGPVAPPEGLYLVDVRYPDTVE